MDDEGRLVVRALQDAKPFAVLVRCSTCRCLVEEKDQLAHEEWHEVQGHISDLD